MLLAVGWDANRDGVVAYASHEHALARFTADPVAVASSFTASTGGVAHSEASVRVDRRTTARHRLAERAKAGVVVLVVLVVGRSAHPRAPPHLVFVGAGEGHRDGGGLGRHEGAQ